MALKSEDHDINILYEAMKNLEGFDRNDNQIKLLPYDNGWLDTAIAINGDLPVPGIHTPHSGDSILVMHKACDNGDSACLLDTVLVKRQRMEKWAFVNSKSLRMTYRFYIGTGTIE